MSDSLYPRVLLRYHIVLVLSESPNNSAKHDSMTAKVLRSIGGNTIRGKNRTRVEAQVNACITQMARSDFVSVYFSKNKRVRLNTGYETYLSKLETKLSDHLSKPPLETATQTRINLDADINQATDNEPSSTIDEDEWDYDDSNSHQEHALLEPSEISVGNQNVLNENVISNFVGLPDFDEEDDVDEIDRSESIHSPQLDSSSANRFTELSQHLARLGSSLSFRSDSLSIVYGENHDAKTINIFEAIDHYLELRIEICALNQSGIEKILEYQCNSNCVFTLCKTPSGRYYLKRLLQTSKYSNEEILGIVEKLYRNALDLGV